MFSVTMPWPMTIPTHDEDLECIGEKNWQIAWVSVHCINATAIENARLLTCFSYLFATSTSGSGLRIKVCKIENNLVSH